MTDTGLMSSILKWRFDDVRLDGDKNGKLLETMVFNQIAAIIDAQDENYELYHYRDGEKREIDFVIENGQGDVLCIEVKAGSVVNKEHFKHIEWFANNIYKGNKCQGIILYTGQHVVPFGKNLLAVPMNALWG